MYELDITKCEGENCLIREDCLRYVSIPEKYQSYFAMSPFMGEEGICLEMLDYNYDDIDYIKPEYIKKLELKRKK